MELGCAALGEHKDSIQMPIKRCNLSAISSVGVLAVVTMAPPNWLASGSDWTNNRAKT